MTDSTHRLEHVRNGYNRAAPKYAAQFFHEYDHKPFDRHLLSRYAKLVRPGGKVYDFGCGPGHAARELALHGLDVTGIDISEAMIKQARVLNPNIEFRVGDMFSPDIPDRTAAGITALYAIVNLPSGEIGRIFEQFSRILTSDGIVLVAFHADEGRRTVDNFLDANVTLDFFFHDVDRVLCVLNDAGLNSIETIVRYPYEGVEYPTRRAYLLIRHQSAGGVT